MTPSLTKCVPLPHMHKCTHVPRHAHAPARMHARTYRLDCCIKERSSLCLSGDRAFTFLHALVSVLRSSSVWCRRWIPVVMPPSRAQRGTASAPILSETAEDSVALPAGAAVAKCPALSSPPPSFPPLLLFLLLLVLARERLKLV